MRPTYQERYLTHRNLLQVYQKHRVMAPFVHDLLAEFGWFADTLLRFRFHLEAPGPRRLTYLTAAEV